MTLEGRPFFRRPVRIHVGRGLHREPRDSVAFRVGDWLPVPKWLLVRSLVSLHEQFASVRLPVELANQSEVSELLLVSAIRVMLSSSHSLHQFLSQTLIVGLVIKDRLLRQGRLLARVMEGSAAVECLSFWVLTHHLARAN